jgi:hypothetical protein
VAKRIRIWPHEAERHRMIDDLPSVSIVVAVDRRYVEQAHLTVPIWIRRCPGITKLPVVVIFCDGGTYSVPYGDAMAPFTEFEDVRLVSWPDPRWARPSAYYNQREMMLSAFVWAHEYVKTDYFLKIDVDAFPVRDIEVEDWYNVKFFNQYTNVIHKHQKHRPAIVSNPWGYTKPADQMQILDDWADRHGIPGRALRIPIEHSKRLRHPRIISWFCFINREFARAAVGDWVPPGRIPVPSQDGFHWYMAARLGWPIRRIKFKSLGWTNSPPRVSRIKKKIERYEA